MATFIPEELKESIRKQLDDEWEENVIPNSDSAVSFDQVLPDMDSLTALECLLRCDQIAGRKLPINLVKQGGYFSKDEFVSELSGKIIDYLEVGNE